MTGSYYYLLYLVLIQLDVGMRCLGAGVFFFQAEDGIRDLVRSRGLGDVYKRQVLSSEPTIIGGRI